MNTPMFYSIFFPALISFYTFSFGKTPEQILLPLLVIHGLAYFFLTGHVLDQKSKRRKETLIVSFSVLFIAAFFGSAERYLAINVVDYFGSENYYGQFTLSLLASFIVMPSLTHFILDGFIWKKTDPYFSKVFESKS